MLPPNVQRPALRPVLIVASILSFFVLFSLTDHPVAHTLLGFSARVSSGVPALYTSLLHDIAYPPPESLLHGGLDRVELVDGRVTAEGCRTLGFEPKAKEDVGEIYDAIIFDGELDTLELRLAQHFDAVNKFFIIDVSQPHHLPIIPNSFSVPPSFILFAEKMIVAHLPPTSSLHTISRKMTEMIDAHVDVRNGQRERLEKGIEQGEPVPSGVPQVFVGGMGGGSVVVGRKVGEVGRACWVGGREQRGMKVGLDAFLYSFDHPLNRPSYASFHLLPWHHHDSTFTLPAALPPPPPPTLPSSSSSAAVALNIDNAVSPLPNPDPFPSSDEPDVLASAGWLCLGCHARIDTYLARLGSSGGGYRRGQVQDMVCQGGDLYGKAVGAKRWNEVFGNMQEAASSVLSKTLPSHLTENADRLSWLLPGHCKRRDATDFF